MPHSQALQISKPNSGQRPTYQRQALPMQIQRLLLEESFWLHERAIKTSSIPELTQSFSDLALQDHSACSLK